MFPSHDTSDEIGKMIELSIKKAGELLKIKVPLKGEAKVGKFQKLPP